MGEKNEFDEADVPAADDVFAFGESTILQMRNQPFRVGDQFGTVMSTPVPLLPDESAGEPGLDDPLARLERKLDMALRHIDSLQQRLDSIDAALARAINR